MVCLSSSRVHFTAKNGKTVLFRSIQADDTEMLWQMFSTLSQESISNLVPPFPRERIEGWTSNINPQAVLAVVAVVKEAGAWRIVGVSSLKFYSEEAFGHKADLGLTVHDSYQNQGIGTALLTHMITLAKKRNLTKVCLTVHTENVRAVHLYKKAGFEIEGVLKKEMHYKNRFTDEYRMALFL
jgi:RimJ/RimL family protein N-acetyltransferase